MIAEIISIGEELLSGETANTNAAYLGKNLSSLGIEVRWITTVGDHAENLRNALAIAMKRSKVVITTGGLGPTHDDITKNVAADYFDSKLILDRNILNRLKRAFEKRRIQFAKINEEQALVPEKANILNNPVGTAPGLLFQENDTQCYILPGVPAEMVAICKESVFPALKAENRIILQKTIRTTGIAESVLFEKLGDIKKLQKQARLAFLPKLSGVDIRVTVIGKHRNDVEQRLQEICETLTAQVGSFAYGFDDEELEETVAKMLLTAHKTVAVAESCTGGLLAHKLTNVSGSSKYFERGVVAYSNEAKMQILDVPETILIEHGAVSSETAVAMAEGVRKISGTDYGIATTGIAGPTGGTKEKPVGTIFIGIATEKKSYSRHFLFTKDRQINKTRFAQAALNLLRIELIKQMEIDIQNVV